MGQLALLTLPICTAVLVVQQLGREVGDGAGDAHVLGAIGAVAVPCSPITIIPLQFIATERHDTTAIQLQTAWKLEEVIILLA